MKITTKLSAEEDAALTMAALERGWSKEDLVKVALGQYVADVVGIHWPGSREKG